MKIIIPANKRALLDAVLKRINTKYQNNAVTVIINKINGTIQFISGQFPLCSECSFPISQHLSELKDVKLSIDGSFAKQITHYFSEGQDIELKFKNIGSDPVFVELVDTTSIANDLAIRSCKCQTAQDMHITYVTDPHNPPCMTVTKTDVEQIVNAAAKNLPFEFIEFNKEKKYIRIQRQDTVEDKLLPEEITLPGTLVFTATIKEQVEQLCQITSSNQIEITQENENMIFKTPEYSLTCSLAGVQEFYRKTPVTSKIIKSVALNLFTLKEELKHCVDLYPQIKTHNTVLFYLNEDNAAIVVLTDYYEFIHPMYVFKVINEEKDSGSLFTFSPRDFKDIQIENSNEPQKSRLEILKDSHGKLSLRICCWFKKTHRYYTLAIENDERELDKVKTMLNDIKQKQVQKKLQKQANTTSQAQKRQGELFDFGI
ncbi:hypothetical protein FJQ87_13980 [Shewanella sp. SNU WT4]|uniref:hypothetical protein n=1 Tax=Shewanella sp. SNU WT4 TaxID=2590015 RepID=UPI001129DACA|nr:hypothetical protein [Shewanella sp. SNU WT4]QDF67629.1 hypothetical protein FJQ87_13980 [Shewanella sp. SNU WT4]